MSNTRLSSPALLALAVAAFAIGTAEFVIMGLLPAIAADLAIDLPRAGYLVSAYALGVVAGGPLLAGMVSRHEEKRALSGLMLIFIAGNLGCLLAPGLYSLLLARIVTAFSHASFIGAAAVLAARLAPAGMAGRAMALMFSGMTLANILGVPGGALLGQWAGWRATFAAVMALGLLGLLGLLTLLLLRICLPGQVWLALGCSVLASCSMFSFFTYLLPILRTQSALPPAQDSQALLLCGLGIAAGGWLGGWLGGRLADWRLAPSLAGSLSTTGLSLALFHHFAAQQSVALALVAAWGAAAFAVCMLLQAWIIRLAGSAASRASTLNIGAFNLGNALGAWAGGLALEHGWGLSNLSLLAAAFALTALLAASALSVAQTAPSPAQT
ncbi:MFS transporter [Chromobacterium phragmitis]|uniref:MFS transporter n=1 Tax=Chromobacterium phragmitis TaxID=2202141 RepID=UPI0018E066C4|nr:MFS transporter [Chromobacterium phragmitis]